VDDLIVEGDVVCGVITQMGLKLRAKAVVLTVGTFLDGKIHVGKEQIAAGRAGCPPAISLAARLRELQLPVGRLKTGTPPRIDGRTLDYSQMALQPGDTPRPVFSYLVSMDDHPPQIPCHITYTTEKTQEIIRNNLHLSPMYAGQIEGIGPRYCPSIEDKVVRFADKLTHQIFVEPEGLTTDEIYPNGISTSLPFDVQVQFVRSIKGFENAHITRPGYAIEYDFFDPRALTSFLQTKAFSNLFFAGQINGTTGYEEAAAQGLIAGMNAALLIQGKDLWCPRRDEAYIGVLIDDLITRGTQEPYRMFTSRAEYRLLLREDNADLRLTAKGHSLGLVGAPRMDAFCRKQEAILNAQERLHKCFAKTADNPLFEAILETPLQHDCRLTDLLKRPEVSYQQLQNIAQFDLPLCEPAVSEQLDIQSKYQGYIERQQIEIDRLRKHEATQLPLDLDYRNVTGLSTEVIQKLNQIKPATLAQAGRISGITPAALSLLLVYLKKMTVLESQNEQSN
jgi:tRNA uridine 5-carboxymethylaminomethyl modification enzyme